MRYRLNLKLATFQKENKSPDVQEWCKELTWNLACDVVEPVGSVDNRIGIILTQPLLAIEDDKNVLPFGFRESGLNETNSLIWSYDPRRQCLRKRYRRTFAKFLEIGLFYTANRSATSTILRIYQAEMNGGPKMIIDDMHWAVEAYLYRRGFRTKEDIEQLEKIGGTLIRGIWLLMYSVQRARDRKQQNTLQRRGVPEQDQLSAIETLYAEIKKTSTSTKDIPGPSKIKEVEVEVEVEDQTVEEPPIGHSHEHKDSENANKRTKLQLVPTTKDKIKKASTSTKDIPRSSKIKEVEVEVEDQIVEESPMGDPHEHEDSENENEGTKLQLVPATEDELKGAAVAMDHEIFGTADSQEMEQIESLVAAKEDATEFREEDLDILSDFVNQPIDDNAQDFEESLEFDTSGEKIVCSIDEEVLPSRRFKPRDHRREDAQLLVQSGKYYPGYWDQKRQVLNLRIAPNIASIVIGLPISRREDWPEKILVKAFIHPGRCHPKRWATECYDNEPAARLAFSVSTEKETFFVRNPGLRAAYKANTFMDWISDAPLETLLLRPRRLINAHGQEYVDAFGLPRRGTWMTDEKAQLQWAGRIRQTDVNEKAS